MSVTNAESSIYINLLKQFELCSKDMINNDKITSLLCCGNDIKSHYSGGNTVPLMCSSSAEKN